jgi:hypothetical protein
MLELYSHVSKDEAGRAFHGSRDSFCDGQFVLTDGEMLCEPTSVRWRPAKPYSVNSWKWGGPPTWLPEAPAGRYQLFIRGDPRGRYIYLGPANRSVHSTGNDPWVIFGLIHKMPRAEWVALSGYSGWTYSGDVSGHLAEGDAVGLDALLAKANDAFFEVSLERYEGDRLMLHTNARRGFLQFNGRRVVGEAEANDPPEVFRPSGKQLDIAVPASNTLPKQVALDFFRRYVTSGRVPEDIRWQPDYASGDDWLFTEIATSLRHLFGYSQQQALDLLAVYNARRGEWQASRGPNYHGMDMLHHEGPESMAYIIQWVVALNGQLSSMAFLDWRKNDYQRRSISAE